MDRKREQADLIRKLGQFIGPIQDLVDHPERYDRQQRAKLLARAFAERQPFRNKVNKFCSGEPGHHYQIQEHKFSINVNALFDYLQKHHDDTDVLQRVLSSYLPRMQEAILEVPVEGVADILEANSPFTACCKIQDLCTATLERLVWTDRYFDASVFPMYLRGVRDAARVELVTWPRERMRGKRDEDRWDEFLDMARMFAQERGRTSSGWWRTSRYTTVGCGVTGSFTSSGTP